MGSSRTHYDTLGIDRAADDAAVRRAWKVHVQVWHPDRFTGETREEAERQTARINEAYFTLRDSAKRAAYDRRIDAEAEAATASSRRQRETERVAFTRSYGGSAAADRGMPRGAGAGGAAATVEPGNAMGEFAQALVAAARRYPRATAAIAAVWILLVILGPVADRLSGPSLPAEVKAGAALSAEARDTSLGGIDSTVGVGGGTAEGSSHANDLADAATAAAAEASSASAGADAVTAGQDTAPPGTGTAPKVSGGGASAPGAGSRAATPAGPAYGDPYADPYAGDPGPEAMPVPRRVIRIMPRRKR